MPFASTTDYFALSPLCSQPYACGCVCVALGRLDFDCLVWVVSSDNGCLGRNLLACDLEIHWPLKRQDNEHICLKCCDILRGRCRRYCYRFGYSFRFLFYRLNGLKFMLITLKKGIL